jgi:hypothetical protein
MFKDAGLIHAIIFSAQAMLEKMMYSLEAGLYTKRSVFKRTF